MPKIAQAIFNRRLTRVLALPLLLILMLAGVLFGQIRQLLDVMQWVDHTDRAISFSHYTEKLLVDMETGLRGYLVTGNRNFLQPYNQGSASIEAAFNQFSNLIDGNPTQQQRLTQLRQHYAQWHRYAEQMIVLRERKGDYQAYPINAQGKQRMDIMRGEVASIIQTEEQFRQSRTSAAQYRSQVVLGSSIVLTLGVGGILALFIKRQLREVSQSYKQALVSAKEQTEALKESEERFRSMADTAPVMIWVAGSDKVCHYFNKGWLEFTGRTLEQELENGWLEGVHPEDLQKSLITYNTAFDVHQPFRMEYRLRRASGEYRWVLDTGTPRFNADGSFVGYIGSCLDITERKISEEKIREQAALLDITTDAILVQDLANQNILFWNQSAERIYGWKKLEVLGISAKQLLYKDALSLQVALDTVTNQGTWQGELHTATKEGSEVIVSSRWTLVLDELGQPKSILTFNTDITEKKQLEAQFYRAQRLESVGTLASGIAHDLNNVLAPIIMAVELLDLKLPDEQSQRWLSLVESNARRGASLVKQVLSFARGVEGDRTLLEVRHLLWEIKNIIQQTFPKSIETYADIVSDLWTVSGDATQLHQVLLNLCVNARDAMPDGGTLSIVAENIFIDENYARMSIDASIGSYIVITVSDTGTGMPSEVLDRIFEPFFTTKEQGAGTGLGLSTVMGIVKSHGGFVNVYSEVGCGTQFKVYLPAVLDTETQAVTEASEVAVAGTGELILVVDDEESICEITKITLEKAGYQVITASNGYEAIAIYAQHKDEVSVVLTDMMMPEMDGLTAINMLKQINHLVKIIAVSGLESNQKLAANAGDVVKSFLPKPYTAKQLLTTINEVINS